MQSAPPVKTAAQRELRHLLRNYPRAQAEDMAQRVFAMHPVATQLQLALQLQGASLEFAEVGSTAPNAYTRCFHDNSRLVLLNSGLIAFVRAVNRILFGASHLEFGPASRVAALLSPERKAAALAELYLAWKAGGIWREQALEATPVDLAAPVAEDAEWITRAALLFILSHELGHAVLHFAKLDGRDPAAVLSQEDELEADAFGLRLSMTGWGSAGAQPWRAAAAGALIALRLFSGLKRLGHVFPGDHPPPEQRIDALRATLRALCVTEEAYYHVTTVAFAEEESMEGAERILLGEDPLTGQTAERIVSGLCAILEQAEKDQWPAQRLAGAVEERLRDAPDSVLQQSGAVLGRILSPHAPWYAQSAHRRGMVGLLDSLLPTLPVSLVQAYR